MIQSICWNLAGLRQLGLLLTIQRSLRLRVNQNFEIGIHPNFNPLLDGYFSKNKNAEEVLERILDIVPAAKSLRSHSMTQNSRLLDLFAEKGITHESNHFIPFHSEYGLDHGSFGMGSAELHTVGSDDIHIMYSRIKINENNPLDIAETSGDGVLKVFDFHPIHIFLNTESMERYESTLINASRSQRTHKAKI